MEPVAEPEGDTEPAAEPVAEPQRAAQPGRPRLQDRINELTEDRAKAQERADRAEKLLADMLAERAKPPVEAQPEPVNEPPPAPPPADPRPPRDQFETPDAYDAALEQWSTDRALQIFRAEQQHHEQVQREAAARTATDRQQAQSFEAIQSSYKEHRTAALEKYPDYAEVAERDDGSVKMSVPMGMAIMQAGELGPDAAYYLGKNPDVAERISAMVVPGQFFENDQAKWGALAGQPVPDVQRQLIEMGKVFAAVTQPAKPATPEPAPLPEPIAPLRRGTNAARQPSLEEVGNEGTMEDYAAARNRAIQDDWFARRGGRPN